MTMPDPIPDDLEDFLDGPEPPWEDPPEPPPDAPRANALFRRLTRLLTEREQDGVQVRVHTEQVKAWATARDEARTRQETWLREALRRYHQAVLVTNPKALSINLPAGDLVSRLGQPEWITDEQPFRAWAIPEDVETKLAAARARYETEVGEILKGAPVPEVVRVKPATPPEISVSGMKDALTRRDDKGRPVDLGVTEHGERPPGLTVKPAERNFDLKPRTADTSSTEDEAR